VFKEAGENPASGSIKYLTRHQLVPGCAATVIVLKLKAKDESQKTSTLSENSRAGKYVKGV